jgi:CBS domain-containing protein
MSTAVNRAPLTSLSVADVMSPGLLACSPSMSLRAVARTMVVHQVHAVAMWDVADGRPAIVSDLDLVAAAGAIDTADAAAVAHPCPTVAPGDGVLAAAATMAESGEAHLVVVEPESGRPTGMLSTFDVAAAVAGRNPRSARTVRPRAARPAISTSRLDKVQVARAMHVGVFVCAPETTLRDAAAIFVDRRVHCVAVAGTPGAASWKFVTDLGLVRAATRDAELRVADVVDDADWIAGDATLDEAAKLMVAKRASHLLVRGHRAPVGVLSTLDIVDVLAVDAD